MLVLLIIGVYWFNKENKKIKALKIRNTELRQKLDGSIEIMKALEAVESEYRTLKEQWSHAPKQIVAVDEPSFSLYYLNWLVNNYRVPIEFDFELRDISKNNDLLTFLFLLAGEGSYQELYRFIWFITENPLLYQIESFSIGQSNNPTNLIGFTMLIRGFSSTQSWESGQDFSFTLMKPVVENMQFHDVFKPLRQFQKPTRQTNIFRRDVPKIKQIKIDPALVDIETAALQAVANERAYIKDRNGKLLTLKSGEKVRFGRLTRINQKRSEVEFVLNKNGVTKTVILGLGYKK
ncbi:MAG: hypothetical protein JSW07_22105 [bacterium]|nr:MAG: hypothetical protein JSW07_22105 [bacterium]